ncbi:Aldehyde/histidinol dehydrogenase [Phakopsora pachyrhizi]|uniref:Aldehyde/histidinol dehydrogenase n=1 Tax=Phakopsora pachyrhizi TaxID=170000 RepID=A0AAV0BWU5_PHAPC|nr:Aldehyde/histidinol dehydrogenase [Phakopsora pachyrhizi]
MGGIAVQTAASKGIVPVFLELGGKDAAYVRDDADINWTADQLVNGSTFNSGHSCCSVERVYVHESIYEKFVEAVKKVLAGYKLGNPFDPTTQIGPVIIKAIPHRLVIDDSLKGPPGSPVLVGMDGIANWLAESFVIRVSIAMRDSTTGVVGIPDNLFSLPENAYSGFGEEEGGWWGLVIELLLSGLDEAWTGSKSSSSLAAKFKEVGQLVAELWPTVILLEGVL